MNLRDLDAHFVGGLDPARKTYHVVDSLSHAQGLMFQCPKCGFGKPIESEDGRRFIRGAHYILCWFKDRGVPDGFSPAPGRWNPAGTGIDDLSFVAPGAASVLLTSGCNWHGFIHKGQTVDA